MATIWKYPNSRWQAVIRRKGAKPQSKTFPGRATAVAWARAVDSNLDQGITVDHAAASRTLLSGLIQRHLGEVTPRKKGAPQERRRLRPIDERLGHVTLALLDGSRINQYRNRRIGEGVSGASVNRELAARSHIIDVARKEWNAPIAENPLRRVARLRESPGRSRRVESDEERPLLDACIESRATQRRPLIVLALETAMRLGELLALRWVDFAHQLARSQDTKNGTRRIVPLSTRAISCLDEMQAGGEGEWSHL